MPAKITLINVAIKQAKKSGRVGPVKFSGTVTLHADSGGLVFDYEHQFNEAETVEMAIINAAASLKRDLDALSAATKAIL